MSLDMKQKKPKGQTKFGKNCQKRAVLNYTVIDNGVKIRKQKAFYGKTLKEACTLRDEYKRKINKGIKPDDAKVSVSDYVDKWLALKQKNMNVNNARAKDIKKYSGHMRIGDVRRSDIQFMINQFSDTKTIRGKYPGKKSVESLRYVSHQVFEYARLDMIIEMNPVQSIDIPSYEKSKVRPLTMQEIDNVLNLEHKWQKIFIILLHSGLRRSELIPLKWKDIDWDNQCIIVNKSTNFISNQAVVKYYTKNEASNRKVYITNQFKSYLDGLYSDDSIKYRDRKRLNEALICPSLTGKMFSETQWTNMLKKYHTDYELAYGNPNNYHKNDKRFELTLPILNPHMFRHTFCCSMFYAGIPVNIAQRQMGHEKASTTLDIYAQCENDETTRKEIDEKMSKADTRSPQEKLLEAIFSDGKFPTRLLK